MLLRMIGEEDGSLPLAMLAVMIVTSLVMVATTTMVMGQQQTRRDRAFEESLQVADTALNRVITLVEARQEEATFCLGTPPSTLPNYAGPCSAADTVPADQGYTGQAVRDDVADEWILTVQGTVGGRTRTLQTTIPMGSPFSHSPLGRQKLNLQGGNRADSYRSGSYSLTFPRTFQPRPYDEFLDTNNTVIDPTGRGIFTTEGPLELNGQSFANSDGAQIFYAKNPGYLGVNYVSNPLPGATGICLSVTQTCQGHGVARDPSLPLADGNRRLDYYRDRVVMPPLRVPHQPTEHYDGANKTLDPGIHVFRSAKLYSTTQILGTPDNPTVIYLTGELTAPTHARINFQPDPTNPAIGRPKPATGLVIYSTMQGTAVNFPTGVQIAGGVYAPYGAFSGGSQGEIWGALVADTIRTTGGWKFHYDETMGEMRGSDLKAVGWVELGE